MRSIVVTEAELTRQIAKLERDRQQWATLVRRHGTVEHLDEEIRTARWLRGEDV